MTVRELGHLVLYVRDVRPLGRLLPRRARLAPDPARARDRARSVRRRSRRAGPTTSCCSSRSARTPRRSRRAGASGCTTSASTSATATTTCAPRWRAVQEAGATVVGASDHTVTHSLYILDPDGNEIELYVDVPGVDWQSHPS